MNVLKAFALLATRNLLRRRLRTTLTLAGVALATGVLLCLMAFGKGYERNLRSEVDAMGLQMMLVPLGCPYDAAAKALKGKALDASLPESAVAVAQKDPAVAIAAPMLLATLPRPQEGRTDLWAGVDKSVLPLKPWWKMTQGSRWFPDENSVILGFEAAATELRTVGDSFYSPETGRTFRVCAVLERSGTSDDSMFFIPLATAQKMFRQENRLTAVAIRLKDPLLSEEAAERLQKIPGAQVATLAEMIGVFLNLVSAVRTLALAISLVALAISALAILNTMLTAVLERTGEIGMMRALGASRAQVFGMMTLEATFLMIAGSGGGVLLAMAAGGGAERIAKRLVPMAENSALLAIAPEVCLQCFILCGSIGLAAGVYPAFQASRLRPVEALRTE